MREVAQFHDLAVLRDGNVIDEPRSMPDAVRSTVLNGLPNRFFSVSLAGVNRDVEILPLNIMKSVYMFFGRITALFARQIESHDSPITKAHGEFRHFKRHVHVAHRADDQSRKNSEVRSPPLKSL